MRYNLRKHTPIPEYQNHIPCGLPSCKHSCTNDSLLCIICNKRYHYKCMKISRKRYLEISKKGYVCSDSCFSSIFPLYKIDDIDFLSTLIDSESYPCKICHKECLDDELMNTIQCDICDKWLHFECADDLSYGKFIELANSDRPYFCSDICILSTVPFFSILKTEELIAN